MRLKTINSKKSTLYLRNFQSMGEGLLLIEIKNQRKTNSPFHYFFRDGRKPPLDVALDQANGEIEYITFFLQNEKMLIGDGIYDIEILDGCIEIIIDEFNFDNYHIYLDINFDISYSKNSIIVSRKEIIPKKAIRISEGIYILFTDTNDFTGLIITQISKLEINEMKKSEVLVE